MLVSLAALVWLAAADGGVPKPSSSPFRNRPDAAPAQVALPKDSHPRLSNPQITVEANRLYVARVDAPPGSLSNGIHVSVVSLEPGGKASAIDIPAPVIGDDVQLLLSPNEKQLAALTAGELWIVPLGDKSGDKGDARRLYPPETGDATIGPRLTHAAFSRDSTWILLQSPLGWARVSASSGELAPLPLHPVDLTGGSLALSPDDQHVLFVKPQNGVGYQNGSAAVAVNVDTNFAQVLDSEHLYTEVLFLPDGKPVGMDSDGALWLLLPQKRLPYFTPPAPRSGSRITSYAVNLGLSSMGWLVAPDGTGKSARAELWTATPPLPPKPTKASK